MRQPFGFIIDSRRIAVLFLLLLPVAAAGVAQDFGRFRPGISWYQVDAPAVRVIFPEGLEKQALRVANNITHLELNARPAIGNRTKKIDLILNNQGIISNGYVTLSPYRSEFYTTPQQDGFSLGTKPWLDLLSVHEYRHALQYNNMNQGFTRKAHWLFGDTGWGTMMTITTPGWYFEGDAVVAETALTDQGRGRMPSFLQQSKSILLNDKSYSYMKARNGSFRDRVPDEYELGYLLCSYGRENYGNDMWLKVIRQTMRLKGIIYPFSDAVRAETGMGTRKFYKKALADYKESWGTELRLAKLSNHKPLTNRSGTVTDYRFPVYLQNGDLLVYRESYNEIGGIYRIEPDGFEERIITTGISLDNHFSAAGNLISWTEVSRDPRYSSQNYSNVLIYNTELGTKTRLTSKKRYFSPAISPDGTRIAVVEVDPVGKSRLKILDSRTGEETLTLPNDEDLFFTYPKWDTDGSALISSARTSQGNMLIVRQTLTTGSITKLSDEYHQILGEVFPTPEKILFTSGFSGTNNIHSLARSDGKLTQLTGSRFGAYNPALSPDHKKLVFADFDLDGYGLATLPMDSTLGISTVPVRQDQIRQYDFKYFKTDGGPIFDQVSDTLFGITPYRPWQHLVKVHSWSLNPGLNSIGLKLTSDNILENLHLEGGASYYYNEQAPGFEANVQYGGFYPVLTAGISRFYRHPDITEILLGEENTSAFSLDDKLSLGIKIPLTFIHGAFYTKTDLSIGYDYISAKDLTKRQDSKEYRSIINSLSGKAGFSSVKKSAYQNITTPLGFSLDLTVNRSIGPVSGFQFQTIADFAISGPFYNHNLVLSAGWKYELYWNDYQFMDLFLYPRGYVIPDTDRMLTVQSSYHFPLVYPDLGFWGIFYCPRIRADLFADCGYAYIPDGFEKAGRNFLASVGTELIFDTKWFNLTNIPMGVRFSWLLKPDPFMADRKIRFEFVIPVIRL